MAAGLSCQSTAMKWTEAQLQSICVETTQMQRCCDVRGLVNSSKWHSELAMALESHLDYYDDIPDHNNAKVIPNERSKHSVALNYCKLGEYERAQHLIKDCKSPPVSFLHYYCRYLAGENRSGQPSQLDSENKEEGPHNHADLCNDLRGLHKDGLLDSFLLYLYGIVLKKCGYSEDAQAMLTRSISQEPCFWGSWYELAGLIDDRNDLSTLVLPDHWMKQFFLAHTYLSLQLSDYAADIYTSLLENGFEHSYYIIAQLAVAYDNMKDIDMSIQQFELLREKDPYRLENMDTYSNALYVKDMRVELADLAARCTSLDKYKAETCCVIGNYYSLREQHEHAVLYFQRALKLNPNFISAWTLMGHEYMEMNNQNAAIHSYRQALDVDSRDFRAWYGLGQTHEILKMHHYSLYYFQQALKLRPNDSRMLMAVGCAFQQLNKPQEAKICFWKAHMLGDPEGIALTSLAKLHESLKEDENAAAAFTKFVLDASQSDLVNPKEVAHAYRFLANYNLKTENYEEAYIAAQKCVDFPETREEGKALVRQITQTGVIPDEMGESLERVGPVMGANDSLTHEVYSRAAATPAPQLSPLNLSFCTPDHM